MSIWKVYLKSLFEKSICIYYRYIYYLLYLFVSICIYLSSIQRWSESSRIEAAIDDLLFCSVGPDGLRSETIEEIDIDTFSPTACFSFFKAWSIFKDAPAKNKSLLNFWTFCRHGIDWYSRINQFFQGIWAVGIRTTGRATIREISWDCWERHALDFSWKNGWFRSGNDQNCDFHLEILTMSNSSSIHISIKQEITLGAMRRCGRIPSRCLRYVQCSSLLPRSPQSGGTQMYSVLFFANKMPLFFGLNGFNQGGYVSFGLDTSGVCVKFRFASYRSVLAFGTVFAVVAQMKLVMFGPFGLLDPGPQGLCQRRCGETMFSFDCLPDAHCKSQTEIPPWWSSRHMEACGTYMIYMVYHGLSKNIKKSPKHAETLSHFGSIGSPSGLQVISQIFFPHAPPTLWRRSSSGKEMSGGWSLQHLSDSMVRATGCYR